ncbi:RNA polymerase sigma-70 factor [Chitinophaga sp. 22321]|uniref:RNA polymerase sigma-70 factor n=1 Tax=Chitinophaga hostae TaxID=2831022 RepID=A0ABS5J9U2_9BACT|nr:RNA polymerase sigma-70 factor [Chitinophaga hostae]MBS0031881.1 RNA polymerase sigma-70 factor [Chitinophaga hostae]
MEKDKLAIQIEQYFHTWYERLHRYAFTILKDNDDAKDAVQAVFLKLWEKRDTIDEEQSVKSYLYTAVYNYCLNIKRHDKIKARYVSENSGIASDPGNELMGKEVNRRIMDQVAALSPQCRLVFTKSRFEGKKYAEIAAEMGLSVKTVEAQMGKALKILREKLLDLLISLIIFFLL